MFTRASVMWFSALTLPNAPTQPAIFFYQSFIVHSLVPFVLGVGMYLLPGSVSPALRSNYITAMSSHWMAIAQNISPDRKRVGVYSWLLRSFNRHEEDDNNVTSKKQLVLWANKYSSHALLRFLVHFLTSTVRLGRETFLGERELFLSPFEPG